MIIPHILLVLVMTPFLASLAAFALATTREDAACALAFAVTLFELFLSIVLLLSFDLSAGGFQFVEEYPLLPEYSISLKLGVDGISVVMVLLCAIVCLVSAWAAWYMIEHRKGLYYATFLMFETGVMGCFTCLNLALFYVFWELVLVPMFFLIGEWGPRPERARYAAVKFFIFTHVGSVLMLLGFVYLFLVTGTFDIVAIAEASRAGVLVRSAQIFAMLLIFWGPAIKLPVVPLHTWLPFAHGEAPAPVSALLAGLLLKMGGYLFVRLVWMLPQGFSALVWPYLFPLAFFACMYSPLAAMMQRDIKYLVAFTSICHMSFVFFACVAAAYALAQGLTAVAQMALLGAVMEMFAHGVVISLCFLMAGITEHYAHIRDLEKMRGLAHRMKGSATLWTLAMLSAGGFPGTVGFPAELTLFFGALNAFWNSWSWASVVLLSPWVVLAYFAWRVVQRGFLGKLSPELAKAREAPLGALLPEIAVSVPIILFGIAPWFLFDFIKPAVAHMTLGL